MDILEVLEENIEANDVDSICKLVDRYLSIVKNKNELSRFLVNLFARRYISKNLWALREFAMQIAKIESASKSDIALQFKHTCVFLSVQKPKSFPFLKNQKISETEKQRIHHLVHVNQKEYDALAEWKDILLPHVYVLLNVVYDNLIHSSRLTDSLLIIKYTILAKKKDIFIKCNGDMFDHWFLLIMLFAKNNNIVQDVVEYVHFCKDLFCYRVKVKEKIDRIYLLYYSLMILILKSVKSQAIDYKTKDIKCLTSSKQDVMYLYVLLQRDEDMINQVNNERNDVKKLERAKRIVHVQDVQDGKDTQVINIVRL